MHYSSKILSPEYSHLNNVIKWYLALRWTACLGVLGTLLMVRFALQYELPYRTLYLLNGLVILGNLIFMLYYSFVKRHNLSRKEMTVFFHLQICSDYALLLLLVYFTGFLENPFIYYFVFHILLTSFIFSRSVVIIYVSSLIAVLIAVGLAEYLQFIPHFSLTTAAGSLYFEHFFIRTAGLCTTLVISAYLITSIKKRIEEKGRRVEIELDHYRSLDKIKSNFILQVTHELRGPLAALMGYHEMIMRGITGPIHEKTKSTIFKANRRTANLLTMIDEMIDYAYMKSEEEVELPKTETSLKEAFDHNFDLFLNPAKEKGITFTSNCSKDLKIMTNRDLLNIILSNLLSNAIRYSPAQTSVTVNAERENDEIHIMVKDEGIGIKPDEIDKIFEEFYRTRRALEIEKDGTGLGLPIVQKAVDALGGRITVYSEEGKGTTFHVYFRDSLLVKK